MVAIRSINLLHEVLISCGPPQVKLKLVFPDCCDVSVKNLQFKNTEKEVCIRQIRTLPIKPIRELKKYKTQNNRVRAWPTLQYLLRLPSTVRLVELDWCSTKFNLRVSQCDHGRKIRVADISGLILQLPCMSASTVYFLTDYAHFN